MPECKINGCENTNIAAYGMCWKHYARERRRGTTDDPEYINDKPCSVAGCSETARSQGMCHRHFMRYDRYGDPSVLFKRSKYHPPLPCVMKGCEEPQKSRDLCHKHYYNFLYHKKKGNVEDNIYEYVKFKEGNT